MSAAYRVTHLGVQVPWGGIRIAFVGSEVTPQYALYALNASIVGLCIDNNAYVVRRRHTVDRFWLLKIII